MSTKNIEIVVAPKTPHYVGDGFRVHNFIPSGYRLDMERMSPFILMDYNAPFYFPPTDKPRGVSVHPHRGFETVTIAYKGRIAHHDSAGNSGVIKEGDVQWMTAAAGILHKEYHETEFSKAGGEFQMVQLWVNLPAKDKMSAPKYQGITHEQIHKYELENNKGIVEVIAGEYKGVKGTATTFTPVNLLNTRLNKNVKTDFNFPSTYNTALLVLEGEIKVNDTEVVPTDHFVLFENKGEDFVVEAMENAIFLVLSGAPINEPIAAQGPFVMNTKSELVQAIEDYNLGKFGHLEE
ncbi:pirin family protein [Arenibacter sp. 6A1]|uniref:pirin family protein n=1 Tax=Arenibacter sp. 6A1 TaxID=2720391 RepID=UPI0014455E96|nr:pirin family protein [Arenibacter sp. 6A1]NKI26891.1 pirin family protein [Arenibacter sp. 6A1]